VVACLAVAAAAGVAGPRRAAATGGLEDLVGPVDPTVAAQLPSDPRIWGAYSLRPTPDACSSGAPSCLDKTIATMTQRFDGLAPTCDHDAVFSMLYLRVTQHYGEVVDLPGFFVAPRTVNYEDRVFAQLYTGAYDDWHANRPATVPPAWRLAFAAADSRQVSASGDALLGMVAHIRRDLPFALWRIAMGSHDDHLAVNTMLEQVYPAVVAELARRFDPTISLADTVPGTGRLVMDVVEQWREQGWQDALELVAAPDQASFTAVAERIERDAWTTGLEVYLGTRYVPQALTVVRDSYCATHWNT